MDGGPECISLVGARGNRPKTIINELTVSLGGAEEDKAFSHSAFVSLEALSDQILDQSTGRMDNYQHCELLPGILSSAHAQSFKRG